MIWFIHNVEINVKKKIIITTILDIKLSIDKFLFNFNLLMSLLD